MNCGQNLLKASKISFPMVGIRRKFSSGSLAFLINLMLKKEEKNIETFYGCTLEMDYKNIENKGRGLLNEEGKERRLKRNFVARINYQENDHCTRYSEGKRKKLSIL